MGAAGLQRVTHGNLKDEHGGRVQTEKHAVKGGTLGSFIRPG